MKFKCNRNTILQEIITAYDIISVHNILSIHSNVFIEASNGNLIIRAIDSNIKFETKLPVETISPGSTTVFCEKLLGILKSIPDEEILFSLENSRLHIIPEIEKANFQIKIISLEQYPEFIETPKENFFQFPQKNLVDMISKTIFSVSYNKSRHIMNGVYIEKIGNSLSMVATDGRRLSYIKKEVRGEIKDFSGVIVPPKALNIIRKVSSDEGNISLAILNESIVFHIDNKRISSNLIEGDFPDYKRIIPESQKYKILIDREEFYSAVARVSLFVEDKSKRVYLLIQNNFITLRSEETDIGMAKEEISCSYEGPESEFCLNCSYLNDSIKSINSKEILILYTDPKKIITILSSPEEDYFHIIMPMIFD